MRVCNFLTELDTESGIIAAMKVERAPRHPQTHISGFVDYTEYVCVYAQTIPQLPFDLGSWNLDTIL